MSDNLHPYRIKFFCRSFDLRLYRLSKGLYERMGFECVRLTDQKADGYFYTMLRDESCDIAINVDEDAFITDPEAVMNLVSYVVAGGYANAGCPDGGGACPRTGNPVVTNPFFNVFNLRLIRSKFSLQEVKHFDYTAHKERVVAAFPKERLERKYDFDRIDYEPYYPYLLWLASNFNTLYLPSRRHADGVTTLLLTPTGEQLCMHTWFARFYSAPTFMVRFFQKDKGKQKARIDAVIREAYALRQLPLPTFSTADRLHFMADKLIRWTIKIPQRIAGWPRKLKKKLNNKHR